MGTPSTSTVLDIVMEGHRKRAPTLKQRVGLLEARRETLRPGLRYMAIKPMDEFPIHEGMFRWTLRNSRGSIVDSPGSGPSNLQGCYYQLNSTEDEFILVGLSRQGKWVWAVITRGNLPEGLNQEEKVLYVNVRHLTSEELVRQLGTSFHVFWIVISDQIKLWVSDPRQKLAQAERVSNEIEFEDGLLRLSFDI